MNTRTSGILAIILSLMFVTTFTHAQPGIQWTQTFGGGGDDWGESVQQTSDGGYIIAGHTTSYGSGSYDIYLIKTDDSGIQLWSQDYGGIGEDKGYSVQQTSDNGYIIVGATPSYFAGDSDIWLVKSDALGLLQWDRHFGGTGDDCSYSVQQTNDGGYIIVGYTSSFGAGLWDVYLIKTDASGNEQWSQTYGGSDYDLGQSVLQTSDGGYIFVGTTESYGIGYDVWVIKTDDSGIEQWNRTFGGDEFETAYSVQQTNDGGFIIAGYTHSFGAGFMDVYLIKTDPSGLEQWSQTFGGSGADVGNSVLEDAINGGYVIAGWTTTYGAGLADVYLIKTDASGTEQWSQTFGDTGGEGGYGLLQTSDDEYIIAGGTSSYGGGGNDVWLFKVGGDPPPDFTVALTYNSGSPVPAGGGAINFDVALTNNETSSQNFDLWIEIPPQVTPPSVPNRNLTFPAGHTLFRPSMNWPITAAWPAGAYTMIWNIGDLATTTAWATDSFPFEKSATDNGSGFALWEIDGDPLDQLFEETDMSEAEVVSEYTLHGAYPNPFNPSTVISFQLPVVSNVNLTVYDINGRQVAELVNGWRDIGAHEVTFDATGLSSGIYIYRLEAGAYVASGKIVLMK